ncbi:hypothetical protein [Streptosporangium sp. NPDC000509]|uniref:hypothetical protein n=1 Tax=Streptosporangium sp. NPDC000509 TaxID=3366186 RepID=UPI00369708C4
MPKNRRKKRRANRPSNSQEPPSTTLESEQEAARGWRSRLTAVRVGIATILIAVLGSAGYGLITWLGPDVVDSPKIKDTIRAAAKDPDDITHTVRYEDPGYQVALPTGVAMPGRVRTCLKNWTYESLSDETLQPGHCRFDRIVSQLRTMGAATPNALNLVITLEGHRSQRIKIDDVRPVNIQRRPPYAGAFLDIGPEGPGETIKMFLDLDELNPRARTVTGEEGGYEPGGLWFQDNTLFLEDGKEEALNIKAGTSRDAVTFDIQIGYRIGTEHKQLVINDSGRQFALTPINCVADGRASYGEVWSIQNFRSIDPVKRPERWRTFEC